MITTLKSFIKSIPVCYKAWNIFYKNWSQFKLRHSLLFYRLSLKSTYPPHSVKIYWLKRFQKIYSLETLIETGTYEGATVAAMLNRFKQIYSIELDSNLWKSSHEKFVNETHVHIIQGNSRDLLPNVLSNISDRCLFWLDGHYSGGKTARGDKDSPIEEELNAIRLHYRNDHIILIDDARLFNGENSYPSFKNLSTLIKKINTNYTIKVIDDIIQIYLK